MLAWIVTVMSNRLNGLADLSTQGDQDSQIRYVEHCSFTDHIGEQNAMSGELTLCHSVDAGKTNDSYLNNLNAAVGHLRYAAGTGDAAKQQLQV